MKWSKLLLTVVLLTHSLRSVVASDVIDDDDGEEEEEAIPEPKLDLHFNYHNYTALTGFLRDIAALYPTLAYFYSIGKSVQGSPSFSLSHTSIFLSLLLLQAYCTQFHFNPINLNQPFDYSLRPKGFSCSFDFD